MTKMSDRIQAARKPSAFEQILGVKFFRGSLEESVQLALGGGLVVAPSGPGLADDLINSSAYRDALYSADLAITDSGFMVLLWRLAARRSIPRHSGLKFLREVLTRREAQNPGAIFWVMPSEEDTLRNCLWLRGNGIPVSDQDTYIAPRYGKGAIRDLELEQRIELRKPRIVMLAIGGGVQERLGHSLKQHLSQRPSIMCLGAAIAFLSGGQASIPPWADRLMLGWLLRIVFSPRSYLPRYLTALKLAGLIFRHRDQAPPLIGANGKA